MNNYMPLDFATWIRQAYREPESTSFTIHNMEVAYQAGRASHVPAPAPAREAPVAVLKFERGTPGRENEMPRVVSCNWMPDGKYEVYLAAAPTTQPAQQQEPAKLSDEQIKAHGDKASRMMARDLTRFDAACEVDKYLREQGAPGYYRHRMSIVLFGNVEGTEAARAPDTEPQPSPAAQGDALDAARWHWFAEYLVGPRTDLDDEIVASETVNDLRKVVDAARAAQEGK